ncbi:long-chain fatty acid transport protein 4 [Folsomia candida]|uniref:long-chain fatty acid transport protein 4 n=1 Tax=Folsomia candida TaxID=158441 RepID=UPI001604B440|nr:long-chain fatty acid transport protein 4 [Folsomia candida]
MYIQLAKVLQWCIPEKLLKIMDPKFWLYLSLFISSLICQLQTFIVHTIKTLPRDLTALYRIHKVKLWLTWFKLRNVTVGQLFDDVVKECPDKICFYFEAEKWTFSQVQEYSYKVQAYFLEKGFQKGDCIALMMSNRPEFVCLWLGLSRIGVITSWINVNLKQDSLIHCLKIGNTRAAIIGEEFFKDISAIYPTTTNFLPDNFVWFMFNKLKPSSKTNKKPISPRIIKTTPKNLNEISQLEDNTTPTNKFCPIHLLPELVEICYKKPSYKKKVHFDDVLCYVFTSGTTGLAKAALMTHSRMIAMVYGPNYMIGLQSEDILYTPLPLYHVQGGICGVGQALLFGLSQVMVPKFSVSRFWQDCVKHNATVAQYLGEVCRYLLKHSSPLERAHSVKILFGNGMKTDIWKTFLNRFNYPVIAELYGASEGNCQLGNFEGVIGSCGSSLFGLMGHLFPPAIELFKVDQDTGDLLRDPDTGLALPCEVNEHGELLGLISDGPLREFLGYTDHEATKDKVAFDIKCSGDRYFRSGDIMYLDNLNYFHFVDRLGSSFRWKGENVSSEEVTIGLGRIVGLDKDIVTFGVSIPHTDGNAGMTVIAVNSIDQKKISDLVTRINSRVNEVLPSYARPIFIRFVGDIDATGTYKLQKLALQKDGYEISSIADPLYFFSEGKYTEFTKELYEKVMHGMLRF